MIKFSLAKCKTKAAYSAKLMQKSKLNLDKIKKQYETLLDTPILILIKVDGIEIIVHSHGELMFKSGNDTAWMESTANKIYEIGLK